MAVGRARNKREESRWTRLGNNGYRTTQEDSLRFAVMELRSLKTADTVTQNYWHKAETGPTVE